MFFVPRPAEHYRRVLDGFWGVEVVVLEDQLHNLCSEAGEELVWMKGQLGDKMIVSPLKDGGERSHELEREAAYSQCLRKLLL